MTTVGSLFTGYGGLDMGVTIALDSSGRRSRAVQPPHHQHPHADQAENHNSQHGSSNGSWACPTATSPAQT